MSRETWDGGAVRGALGSEDESLCRRAGTHG